VLTADQSESEIAEVLLILETAPLEFPVKNLRRFQEPSEGCFACIRNAAVFFVVSAMLFFGSFSGSAQAHGLHPGNFDQSIERSLTADVSNIEESLQRVTDDTVSACGVNCCSMSGCGYVTQILAEFGFPAISIGKRHLLKSLPWVRNPLDSLKRPPRA
jgi:hypothetical protein